MARWLIATAHGLALLVVLLMLTGVERGVGAALLALSGGYYFSPGLLRRRDLKRVRRVGFRDDTWIFHSPLGERRGQLLGYKLSAELIIIRLRLEAGGHCALVAFRDQFAARDWCRLRCLLSAV